MTEHGPAVRVPPPVLVAAILGAGWAMRRLLPVPFGAPMPGFGLAVIGMGLALAAWAVLAMLRAGTDPRPDRPDNALLEGGPFRFTRNPIYLGFVLVAAGLALRCGEAVLSPRIPGWMALPAREPA